jgi:hypothetical protein
MLNFIDKLDEEQATNAEKVARAAKRAGVDPSLAVAIAFQESRLRSNPPRGSSGEIGMMQVMPGTGKGMGFNEKQLANLDQNIEAGVQYLKKGLEATGNDPQLTAIYYNGGPGAIQAMSSGKDPDPRVFDYLRSINSYGTFAPKSTEGQQEGQAAPEAAPPEAAPPGETDEQRDARIRADEQAAMEAQERRMGQIGGAGAGAAVSAYRAGKSGALSAASALGEASETGRITAQTRAGLPGGGMPPAGPGAAAAAPSGAPQSVVRVQPPGGLPGGPTQLGAPGTYPTATGPGSATFNYGRVYGLPEIEAGRALGTGKAEGEVWDLLNKRQQALTNIQQRFPGDTFIENPRYGGIMTPQPSVGSGPRQSFVNQPPTPAAPGQPPQAGGLRPLPPTQPIPTAPPKPSGLQVVTQELKALARPVVSGAATVGRYVVPPLALAGAGGEGADVYSELRKDEPDYIKAGLSGVSAASGLAALFPPLTIPASVVGGGAALINYLREREKERQRTGETAPPVPSAEYAAP